MSLSSSNLSSAVSRNDHLIQLIAPWIEPLGYRIIYLEVQSSRQKVLRIYIDFCQPSPGQTIGIEDCVKVSRALEEPLDQIPEINSAFQGHYELEVSSPGVNRPLRSLEDFDRFKGQSVRIHVFRPLTAEELGNPTYQEKNSKQKNFLGTLMGIQEDNVLLLISSKDTGSKKSLKKSSGNKKSELKTNSVEGETLRIPLPLISKANLEVDFHFERSDERE